MAEAGSIATTVVTDVAAQVVAIAAPQAHNNMQPSVLTRWVIKT